MAIKKFSDEENGIEFELEIEKGDCDRCSYRKECESIHHPFTSKSDVDITFSDFCIEELRQGYYPREGTIEKNIPWVIPDMKKKLEKDKLELENQELKKSINTFCDSYCLDKCIEDCPLKKYKNEKNS